MATNRKEKGFVYTQNNVPIKTHAKVKGINAMRNIEKKELMDETLVMLLEIGIREYEKQNK